MSIQGLNNNSFFNLNNIKTLATGSSTSSSSSASGGSFNLGGTSSSTSGSTDFSGSVGDTGVPIGDVNTQDPHVQSALGSVAGESAIQEQFKNQLALVNLQDRIQSQSRTIEILTNILNARHDAALSAARNVK